MCSNPQSKETVDITKSLLKKVLFTYSLLDVVFTERVFDRV